MLQAVLDFFFLKITLKIILVVENYAHFNKIMLKLCF